jgi:hypothetical protein
VSALLLLNRLVDVEPRGVIEVTGVSANRASGTPVVELRLPVPASGVG